MISVLCIDDEVGFLDLVSFFLTRERDFDVETATSAKSALERMQSRKFDAIVVDHSLPGIDGIELLRILRAQGNEVPFMLLTVRGREDAAIQALNDGADFYLDKSTCPQLHFADLVNMIRKSVQNRRSQDAVRQGERFLSSVFASIQDGISVLDKELNIIRVNAAMERWYSHKMPLVGKKCYDAYHGRSSRCDKCPSHQTIETGKAAYEVVPKTGPGGVVVGALDLYTFPLLDNETGELSGVIEYVRDITERRRAEEELDATVNKLKELGAVIDRSAAAVLVWHPTKGWPVTFVSDSIKQFGYTPDDLLSGRVVYDDIVHGDDVARVNAESAEFRRKGILEFSQEYRIVTKSGEVRWVDDRTVIRLDAEGKPALHEGIVMDITERKKAETKLQETSARLQAILSAFPDLYFTIDYDGKILDYRANRPSDLYLPPEQFLGKRVQDVLPLEVAQAFESALDKVKKHGNLIAMEYSLPLKKGEEYFEARLVPTADNQIFLIVRNMTERKHYEVALKQANEKLNLMGSMTRHDVLNQLGVLTGWLSIATASISDRGLLECLNKVKEASETIRTQLEFTADYQEMGIHGPVWVQAETAFAGGVAGLGFGEVALERRLEGLEIYADPMIDKVFHNLVDNSLRHGGKITKIKVTYQETEKGVTVIFSDDGAGVPDNEKIKIFSHGIGKHTGYGLYLTRAILGITGITIEETGKAGQGAVFEICIPPGKYRLAKESRT